MDPSFSKATWIWHSEWVDRADDTSAGGFVHFRKPVTIRELPTKTFRIQINADARYKLCINSRLVSIGPVKADEHLWFYDEFDIQPYFQKGTNHFAVRVPRFFYASLHATRFPRLPFAGLLIRNADRRPGWRVGRGRLVRIRYSEFEPLERCLRLVDLSTRLSNDIKEDDFLHIYENVDKTRDVDVTWMPAKELKSPASHGLTSPWRLSPRLFQVLDTSQKVSRRYKIFEAPKHARTGRELS